MRLNDLRKCGSAPHAWSPPNFQQLWTFTHTSWLSTWSNLNVSVLEFWALIGHLMWVRLQKSSKSHSIHDAGWSSLVARRAHNPEVVGSNPTPATNFFFIFKG